MYKIAKDDIEEGRLFWSGFSWINSDDPHRVPKLYTPEDAEPLLQVMKEKYGYDVKLV